MSERTAPKNETRDVSGRTSLLILAGLLSTLVFGLLAAPALLLVIGYPRAAMTASEAPPGAAGFGDINDDTRRQRVNIEATAHQRLSGYAWNDAGHAAARIPIDRAMDILAEHGWPDAAPPPKAGAP